MNKLRLQLPVARLFAPSEIFAGSGSIGVLAGVGAARLAVLVSRSVAASPASMRALTSVTRRSASAVFTMPTGEPVLDRLREPLEAVTQFRPDWIVAVGGGSVIDAGKLIWALYEHPTLSSEQMSRPHALPPLRGKARFAAAPTTAGSGAEASTVAVFQHSASSRKSFLISHELLPDIAILDPALVRGLPRAVLMASAGDALSHAVEGFASRYASPLTDLLAEAATRRIARAMPLITDDTHDEALSDLLIGACFAGTVQNFAPPGLGHAVAHQLAAKGVLHAIATSALLPRAVELNTRANADIRAKYSLLADALNLSDAAALVGQLGALTAPVYREFAKLDVVTATSDPAFLDGVLADPCARTNPVPLTQDMITALVATVVA